MVTDEEFSEKLTSEFGSKITEIRIDPEHRVNVYLETDTIIDVANYMKHELGFVYPNFCTGTDHKEDIEVLWHIGYPEGPILVILRLKTDRVNPVVPSLTTIWEGFNWHERETYDMLGVKFENHPDLRRLIMPDDWEGHPLREDYVYKKPRYRKLEDVEE